MSFIPWFLWPLLFLPLCQLSLTWWARWRQLGQTLSPGSILMLPHLLASPAMKKVQHAWLIGIHMVPLAAKFTPSRLDISAEVHLITLESLGFFLIKSRILLRAFLVHIGSLGWTWSHGSILFPQAVHLICVHQYRKYTSPHIHLFTDQIWRSIGNSAVTKLDD